MTTLLTWLAVSLLVTGAGALAERQLRAEQRAARWVWLGALAISVGIPLAAVVGVQLPSAAVQPAVALVGLGSGATVVLQSESASLRPWLPGLWLASSAMVALWVLLCAASTAVRTRHARRVRAGGRDVWITDAFGPAAAGLVEPRILLPRWVLDLEPDVMELVVAHESEHCRTHDPALMTAGVLLLAVAPWNVFAWLQLRRLRVAIELDCDRRVLHRYPDARRYGAALLTATEHAIGGALLAPALARPVSSLEVRVRALAAKRRPVRGGRAFAAAGVAALLSAACAAPAAVGLGPSSNGVGERASAAATLQASGTSTAEGADPASAQPSLELANADELGDVYNRVLRRLGISGARAVTGSALVAPDGRVLDVRVPAGEPLASAAREVIGAMRFDGAGPQPRWTSVSIVFSTRADSAAPQSPEGS